MNKMTSSIAITIAISITICYLLYINDDSLDLNDREIRLVFTDSMDGDPQPYDIPTMPQGSLIMIDRTPDRISIGDIIGYRSIMAREPIFHRLIAIDGDTLTLKGDANTYPDTISMDQVVGKVVGVDPYLGKVVFMIRSDTSVLVSTLFIITIMWLITEIISVLRRFEFE